MQWSSSRCCRRVFQIAVDHPRLAQSSETSSTAPEYYFRFAAATLDFRANRLAEPPRVPISRGTPPAHRQPLRNRWRSRRSSASKRGRKGLVQPHPTFHNAPSTHRSSVLDASRLFQASLDDFGRVVPWWHQTGISFLGWCSVSYTRFLVSCRLSEAGPVVFRRIPPWRHKPEVVF